MIEEHQSPQVVADVPQQTDKGPNPIAFGIFVPVGLTMLFMLGQTIPFLLLRDSVPGYTLLFIVGFIQLLSMTIPAFFVARAHSLPVKDLLRLKPTRGTVYLVVALGVVAMWFITQTYLVFQELYLVPDSLIGTYHELRDLAQKELSKLFSVTSPIGLIAGLFAGALMPGIGEELVFRGISQRSLEERLSPFVSILIAGILFGAIHLQPVNGLALIMLGCFFGYVAWRTDSIFPAMFGHFLFNALSIVGLFIADSFIEIEPNTSMTTDDLLELLPAAAVSLVILGVLILWFNKTFPKKPQEALSPVIETTIDTSGSIEEKHE